MTTEAYLQATKLEACTCVSGHICDGNRGHNPFECPNNCPVHGKNSPNFVRSLQSNLRGITIDLARPDDIRALGWMVAVHNDYRLDGMFHTFWLFTKNGRAVKGEGTSDAEALNQVRILIKSQQCPEVASASI